MSTIDGGSGPLAQRRDLLGTPSAWRAADADLRVDLRSALDAADPRTIAAAILGVDLAQGGFEKARDTLASWLLSRGDGPRLLAARALADALRTIGKPGGSHDLIPLVQVAALGAELLHPAAPQAGADERLPLAEAVAAGRPEAASAALRDRAQGGAKGADLERELIGLLYDNAGRAGHLAPFVAAACELRQSCGDAVVAPLQAAVAAALARAVGLPPDARLAGHLGRVAALVHDAQTLHEAQDPARAAAFNEPKFRRHLLEGKADVALKALQKGLGFGIPRELVARSLCLAAAERVLRFDADIHDRTDRVETWADLGWLMVHTSAIRRLRQHHDAPGWLALLAHGVFVVHAANALDAHTRTRFTLPEPETLPQTWDHGPEVGRIRGRIRAGDGAAAMAALRGYLLLVLPEQPLSSELARQAFDDLSGLPAEQATLIATVCAAVEEFNALAEHPHRELLLCAAIRVVTAQTSVRSTSRIAHGWLDLRETGRLATAAVPLPWRER